MAERPFSAYSGDAPYVFVSYAHHDAERVYPELTWLREQGINIWYDEGITPGSRWSDALANALERAAHFVFLVSPRSAAPRIAWTRWDSRSSATSPCSRCTWNPPAYLLDLRCDSARAESGRGDSSVPRRRVASSTGTPARPTSRAISAWDPC